MSESMNLFSGQACFRRFECARRFIFLKLYAHTLEIHAQCAHIEQLMNMDVVEIKGSFQRPQMH